MDKCVITKRTFDKSFKQYDDPTFHGYKYYFKPVGNVNVTIAASIVISNNDIDLSAVAGICRCAFELNEQPPVITTEFLNSLNTLSNIPKTFREKYDHFLTLLYKTGGNEFKSRTITVIDDYPLAFAKDIGEFQRIIELAISTGELECEQKFTTEEVGTVVYTELRITPKGLNKIEKLLNNYFSIIQPKIDTGDSALDRKINHAISLFYQEISTIEDKRSATEELSFILEPLRNDLSNYFNNKDVSAFFQLVNEFDIRHNKDFTKKLIHEEQIEWIFHGLLNTLLVYNKLKKKMIK